LRVLQPRLQPLNLKERAWVTSGNGETSIGECNLLFIYLSLIDFFSFYLIHLFEQLIENEKDRLLSIKSYKKLNLRNFLKII